MKASEILLDDSIPHGTREGYAAGCRGSHCPAKDVLGMSCSQASIRYASDWSYKRRVDAGMSAEAIAADDELEGYVAPKTSAREQRRFLATTPTVTVADSVEPVRVREPEPVVEVPVERPAKWSVRRVWVAFAPDGTMHGPFADMPTAGQFVADQFAAAFVEAVGAPLVTEDDPADVADEQPAVEVDQPTSPTSGRRPYRKWIDADDAELRRLQGEGLSDPEIGRAMERSDSLIGRKRDALGLERNRVRKSAA